MPSQFVNKNRYIWLGFHQVSYVAAVWGQSNHNMSFMDNTCTTVLSVVVVAVAVSVITPTLSGTTLLGSPKCANAVRNSFPLKKIKFLGSGYSSVTRFPQFKAFRPVTGNGWSLVLSLLYSRPEKACICLHQAKLFIRVHHIVVEPLN